MPEYIAEPYDVLYFRGNKSFHFGAWYSEGIFPPVPSTFQGFVRSKLLLDAGKIDASGQATADASALVGNDGTMGIDVSGPFLCDTETRELYFKRPADVMKERKEDTSYSSVLRDAKDAEPVDSDLDFGIVTISVSNEKLEPPEFISLSELARYRTELTNLSLAAKDLVFTEDRVGIGLKWAKDTAKRRSVEPGRFYVTPYKRLNEKIALWFCVSGEGKAVPENGALKLGSESHLVFIKGQTASDESLIEQTLEKSRDNLVEKIQETKTFRLLLLQPGVFEQGWFPLKYTSENGRIVATEPGANVKLQLLSACVGAPITISGYSYVSNRGTTRQDNVKLKPSVRAVPAGSVYLFKILEDATSETIEGLVKALDNQKYPQKISNEPYSYSRMGFNHVILACGPALTNTKPLSRKEY
ncbi:MAG: type III-B CRISPR module-associated Cmr3 family protein [Candidatus Eisenbacteria bacterium]|nr:type III-B CRISPR module-associated Cmr3 family protein [Candidatus Eisenbacteria bacterium]